LQHNVTLLEIEEAATQYLH